MSAELETSLHSGGWVVSFKFTFGRLGYFALREAGLCRSPVALLRAGRPSGHQCVPPTKLSICINFRLPCGPLRHFPTVRLQPGKNMVARKEIQWGIRMRTKQFRRTSSTWPFMFLSFLLISTSYVKASATCGNGLVEQEEMCEDGNTVH